MTLEADRGSARCPAPGAGHVADSASTGSPRHAAARLRTLGRLTGGVAHDVNNLLTVVLASLDLLRHGLPSAPGVGGPGAPSGAAALHLEDAACAARRAGELCRGLLSVARRDPPRPRPLDLNAAVAETVRLLRRLLDPSITVEVRTPSTACGVLADPAQLSEILMNLALNARDAMPSGGHLLLTTTIEPGAGDTVQLAVRDSGSGLAPEALAHLLDPGYTTKPVGRGSGLGLCTVQAVVRGLGGTLAWSSVARAGTEFVVRLPRVPLAPEVRAEVAVPVAGGTGERVLVAEDEDLVREVVQAWLERQGYHVTCAHDGVEALALVRRERFDVVLLDLAMPGISGSAVLAWMHAHTPRVPVVLTSGSGHASAQEERPAGACDFLPKPFHLEELSSVVRRALDGALGTSAA